MMPTKGVTMIRKKVLVPLDGSPWSHQILSRIDQIFEPAGYELILLRVADEPQLAPVEPIVSTLLAGMYRMDDPLDRATSANRARQLLHARHLLERTESDLEN